MRGAGARPAARAGRAPRRGQVRARLVELDERNVAAARSAAPEGSRWCAGTRR
ncbi:hypothetical protein ACFQ0B_58320 [Nonomuraea thailandensis]